MTGWGVLGRRCLSILVGILVAMVATARKGGCSPCSLTFDAAVIKDTTLVHEPILVKLTLTNTGQSASYRGPMMFAWGFLHARITKLEDGSEFPFGLGNLEYCPDSSGGPDLAPGETYGGVTDLSRPGSPYEDTACYAPLRFMMVWPAGSYRAELRYTYDPWHRSLCDDSPYLYDTIQFVVIQELPAQQLALEAYRAAYCTWFTSGPEAGIDALWTVIKDHPNSPYAGEAAYKITSLLFSGTRPPRGVPVADLIREMALRKPYDPNVSQMAGTLMSHLSVAERVELVNAIVGSLPVGSLMRKEMLRQLPTKGGDR